MPCTRTGIPLRSIPAGDGQRSAQDMKKNVTTYDLRITEGSTVEVVLSKNKQGVLHINDPKVTPARIRYPIPDKTTLRNRLLRISKMDSSHPTLTSQLEFYIRSREREIAKHIVELRKYLRKTVKANECVRLAESMLKDEK